MPIDGFYPESQVEMLGKMEGPRSFNTHLSYEMLPKSLREGKKGKVGKNKLTTSNLFSTL